MHNAPCARPVRRVCGGSPLIAIGLLLGGCAAGEVDAPAQRGDDRAPGDAASGDPGLVLLPIGAPCTDSSQCASTSCACADAQCSARLCDEGWCEPCFFAAPGGVGDCGQNFLDEGVIDPRWECGGMGCDGAGGCRGQTGRPCLDPWECQTGVCKHGFCCEADCPGTCLRCDVPGVEGQCTSDDGACAGDCAVCGGGGICAGDALRCTGECHLGCAPVGDEHNCVGAGFACGTGCNYCAVGGDCACAGPADWVILFTHRGTPTPNAAIAPLCGEVLAAITPWYDRESTAWSQTARPYAEVRCVLEQVELPASVLTPDGPLADWSAVENPVDPWPVIAWLEGNVPVVQTARWVTVVHYLPYLASVEHSFYTMSERYDFTFISAAGDGSLIPTPSVDTFATSWPHESVHKLGASDKYGLTAERACTVDPATGLEHDGYDIMCHRVARPQGGYAFPPLDQLRVSRPTALEIGWELYPPATDPILLIHPDGGEIWRRGTQADIRYSTTNLPPGSLVFEILSGGVPLAAETRTQYTPPPTVTGARLPVSVGAAWQPGADYRVRICDGAAFCATSRETFTVE